jgi:hypothetical protein
MDGTTLHRRSLDALTYSSLLIASVVNLEARTCWAHRGYAAAAAISLRLASFCF